VSSTGNSPTRFDTTKRWLWGDLSADFPMKLDFKIGATKRVFTRPTTDEENVETDSVCCVIRLEKYPDRGNALAMKIDHETRIDDNSVCRPNAKAQNFSIPFRRPSVGSGGFSETTPIWFFYSRSTKLSKIASR
jgi:hypothetical protein